MTQYKRIAIDTSKAVFTVHGIDQQDRPVLRINLRRAQMIPFFAKLPRTEIAMEACGSAHHWGRELTALGHEVRLIPPQYVKPYVKRGKNDRNDAEAICEASGRPGMHFVPVKSVSQQAESMVLKVRESLVGQRTQLINALRGHAAEFGIIIGKGVSKIGPLLTVIEQEASLPSEAKAMAALLGQQIADLDANYWLRVFSGVRIRPKAAEMWGSSAGWRPPAIRRGKINYSTARGSISFNIHDGGLLSYIPIRN